LNQDVVVSNSSPLNPPLNVSVNYQPEDNKISLSYSPGVMGPAAVNHVQDVVPLPTNGYRSVPITEPDLSRVPARSALKGGKTRDHLEQKSPDKERVSGSEISNNVQFTGSDQVHVAHDVVKVPPKVAPKPRGSVYVYCLSRFLF
jgi:hypothetical protein